MLLVFRANSDHIGAVRPAVLDMLPVLSMMCSLCSLCSVFPLQMPSMRCGLPFWTCSMLAVYLVVLSVLFLNFYRQSYSGGLAARAAVRSSAEIKPAEVTPAEVTPAEVTEEQEAEPAPAQLPSAGEEKTEKSLSDYRVGTLNHFVRAMMSHGFGCFIKED